MREKCTPGQRSDTEVVLVEVEVKCVVLVLCFACEKIGKKSEGKKCRSKRRL